MRNLKLKYCKQTTETVKSAEFLLLDPNLDDTIYLVASGLLQRVNVISRIVDELVQVPDIIDAEYLELNNEICLATKGGEVLLVKPQTSELSEGTFCDVGIKRMAWSPDQEVVAFVTKTDNVVVMTCTYEPIAEHVLAEECGNATQHFVNVGWGKKETQFHGTEGKSAATQKSDFVAPDNISELPQNVEVNWRADGAYFVVSFVSTEVGRMFKVFDKEGVLNYISESCKNLQPAIAWRPSGNWIAVPQQLSNKSTVALFEKNGLRHREIVLPFAFVDESIVKLRWSADSDILVIETKVAALSLNNLYLYTIGNYHWYLKQVISYNMEDSIATWDFDNRSGKEKTLHVLLQSGRYFVYNWHFYIDKFKRSGVVSVIDGNKLLLTDFSNSVVPPPMSNKILICDVNINSCTFIETDNDELQLAIYDTEQNIQLYRSSFKTPLDFEKIGKLQPSDLQSMPLSFGHLIWFNEHLLLGWRTVNNSTKLMLLAHGENSYKITSSLDIKNVVCAITNCGCVIPDTFFAQTNDGKILQVSVSVNLNLHLEKVHIQLDQVANHMKWFELNDLQTYGLISYGTNQCLYIDTDRVASDVTSFCLADNYLLYTKLTALYFLRLSDKCVVNERKIERGGKLITTINNNARVVLQMPRGNLEAICPPVLTLEIAGNLLDSKQYSKAFDMLRKQRLNLNIICDHNMVHFVENLSNFLLEIKNPNWLNLFISDLENKDLTQTMYASNYKKGEHNYPEGFKIEKKVEYLCEKFCAHMEQGDEAQYRLPIITAYVKLGRLEKALTLIWQQKKLEATAAVTANAATGEPPKLAEDALKYLLYLVDVNDLFNVALGTYDFGVVLFVAQKSQKDPKEFLPFLNELKAHELNYRKFKIDEHLKRHERALENIALCGENKFPEALNYIKTHRLYQKALQCFAKQPKCYEQICLAFADHLREQGKLENASIMYERGGKLSQALLSAKHVLDWERVLILAKKDGQDVDVVARSLVDSLEDHGKYIDAFQLLKNYGHDFAEAIQCLLKGKLFLHAIFESEMRKVSNTDQNGDTEDSTESLIKPNLLAYNSSLQASLLADQELFLSQKQRLLTIRETRALQRDNDYMNGDNGEMDECDLLSDTTSMHSSRYTGSSRGTGKTFRSSKNRRKHERKLFSLKPGNPFEDIALIDALYNLIVKLYNQQQHIHDICKALIELKQDEEAAALQNRYKHLLTLIKDSLDEIWIPELMTTQQVLLGPNIDYLHLQNEQRYAMLMLQKRIKPPLNAINWEHDILN